jgi:membrane-bound lytic murein transglycosylase D
MPPLEYDEIELSLRREAPITAIAHACDTTYKIIREMNPEIRQSSLPQGHFKVRIPRGKAQGFNARLEKELCRQGSP